MNIDHLIAQVLPAAACVVAVAGTFLVFSAYFH